MLVIRGCKILYHGNWLVKHQLVCNKEGVITHIESISDDNLELDANIIDYPEDSYLIPGLIDCHMHGAAGYDVMDADINGLAEISKSLVKEGTTGFLATTMTMDDSSIENALKSVAEYNLGEHKDFKLGSRILGVHLEGPFLSTKHPGAQNHTHIKQPDIDLFDSWQEISLNSIKLITIAPEEPNGISFIRHLKDNGVVVSIGHSNATYEEANEAIAAGACHCTHLFNAMSGFHHRAPGIPGAVLVSDEIMAELIVDGVHLHAGSVKLALKAKGLDKLILVTDAMRARCLGNGDFDLGGQRVKVDGMEARLDSGVLAGSVLTQYQALKLFIEQIGTDLVDLADAVKLSSENPAKQLNVFHMYGSLEPGKIADMVVLDKNLDVKNTYIEGGCVF